MSEQDPTEEALLRLLVRHNRDLAVILLTPGGRVRGWLGGAEPVFGWGAGEIVGQPVDLLFTPEDRARGLPAWEREVALRAGHSEDDRWQLRRDGSRIWTSGSTLALCDERGEVLGYAKLVRDRTDQRVRIEALENRLRALAAENRERQNLLAELAHELRNMLTPLFNASYLLRLNPASATLGAPLESIERQLPALRRIADDLGAAALRGRETRQLQLQLESLDLAERLRSIAAGLQPELEAQGLTLELIVPSVPLPVEMDGERLHQMMLDLLGHAARHTPRGGRVWLKAGIEGPDAVVRVRDEGRGIAPEQLPRILEFFTCVPGVGGQAAEEGSGGEDIDLARVRETVTLHGGTVELRSDGPGRGSEFTLRLPLCGTGQAPESPAAS